MLLENLRKPRLILSLFVFLLVITMLWQARSALTPFAVALIIGYVMLPLVNVVEHAMPESLSQRRVARPLAIFIVYVVVMGVLLLVLRALLQPLISQLNALIASIPTLYSRGTVLVSDLLQQYHNVLPVEVQQQIEGRLRAYNPTTLLTPLLTAGTRAVGAITNTVSFLLGLIVIPFWLFFILNDERTVIDGAINVIPHDVRPDVEAVRIILDRVLSSYIRGQLLVAVAYGTVIGIALSILKVQYSLLLGVAAGVLALFPFIGAVLGAIPAVLVAFFQSPQLALYVALLFLIVQQIDNVFFSPKIIGEAVALHPALIMVVIVVGSTLMGVVGALVAVPLSAVLRDVVHYLYLRVGEEYVTPVQALAHLGYGANVTPRMLEGATPRHAVSSTD